MELPRRTGWALWRQLALVRLNALVIGAWVGFAAGLFVVVGTLSSVVGTLVVPRGIHSRISRTVDRALDAGFLRLARAVRSFERRDDILSVFGTRRKDGGFELFVLFCFPGQALPWSGAYLGEPQTGSRWSARSVARTNDLEAGRGFAAYSVGRESGTERWFKSCRPPGRRT